MARHLDKPLAICIRISLLQRACRDIVSRRLTTSITEDRGTSSGYANTYVHCMLSCLSSPQLTMYLLAQPAGYSTVFCLLATCTSLSLESNGMMANECISLCKHREEHSCRQALSPKQMDHPASRLLSTTTSITLATLCTG